MITIRAHIDGEKFVINSSLLIWTSFIFQFINPVGGGGDLVMGVNGEYRFLAICEHHFMRVHENLVQIYCFIKYK